MSALGGAAAFAGVIQHPLAQTEAITAAALWTWVMRDQPPTHFGVRPRQCATVTGVSLAVAMPSMSAGLRFQNPVLMKKSRRSNLLLIVYFLLIIARQCIWK